MRYELQSFTDSCCLGRFESISCDLHRVDPPGLTFQTTRASYDGNATRQEHGFVTQGGVRALERTSPIDRNPTQTLPALIGTLAERFGDSPALSSRSATLSYRDLASACDAYACWGLNHGLTYGDVVCLYMENRPEYVAVWLGLTRIGVAVALIDTNLAGELLSHSIRAVTPRFVITSDKLAPAVRETRASLNKVQCFELGGKASYLCNGRSRGCIPPGSQSRRYRISARRCSGIPRCVSIPPAPRGCQKRRTSATTV